jgi:hypothetical protein
MPPTIPLLDALMSKPDPYDYCQHGVIRATCTRCNKGRAA